MKMNNKKENLEDAFNTGMERTFYGTTTHELDFIGEKDVRSKLNSGKYGVDGNKTHFFVLSWLKDKEFDRLESREEERLSIARSALDISRSAIKRSNIALIISASILILKIIEYINISLMQNT